MCRRGYIEGLLSDTAYSNTKKHFYRQDIFILFIDGFVRGVLVHDGSIRDQSPDTGLEARCQAQANQAYWHTSFAAHEPKAGIIIESASGNKTNIRTFWPPPGGAPHIQY